ncbi:MAG: acyltransferase domain-containing protein, partial [Burkholderiales bacterium]
GGQWVGMARQLMAEEQVFREVIERCDAAARRYVDWSIKRQLEAAPESEDFILDRIDVIQPVLTAVSIAYAERLRAAGVMPSAVIGHSMGEVAAAHVAGIIDLDRTMQIICRRSALMRSAAGKGAMALVDLSSKDTQLRLVGREGRVTIAVNNSPRSCVISGDPDAVQAVVAELSGEGIFCRLVKVDVASHSHQMEPLATALEEELVGLAPAEGVVPVYSTVLGRRADDAEFGAAYWGSNLRHPVQFADAVTRLLADGVSVFVECGPHPVLLPSIQQTGKAAGVEKVVTISTGDRDEPEYAAFLKAVGGLWTCGVAVDWASINAPAAFVQLPLYPWQRDHHWIEAAERTRGEVGQRRGALNSVIPGAKESYAASEHIYVRGWTDAPATAAHPREWLLLADRQGVAQSLAGLMSNAGMTCRVASGDPTEETFAGLGVVDLRGIDAPDLTDDVYGLLQLVRSANAKSAVWAVTRHAQAVEPGEYAGIDIASSALWGLSAALITEHGDVWKGCVDLDPEASVDAAAKALLDHLLMGQQADVALRGDRRLQPRLRPMQTSAEAAFCFRTDASYLITGGLGAVGLATARWMVEQGARRLVVFGRTPLPERRLWRGSDLTSVAAVKGLEAMGASVTYVAIDVGDEAAVADWLASH